MKNYEAIKKNHGKALWYCLHKLEAIHCMQPPKKQTRGKK